MKLYCQVAMKSSFLQIGAHLGPVHQHLSSMNPLPLLRSSYAPVSSISIK